MSYVKFDRLNLKSHPEYGELWVQDRIAEDPSILGFGDVILKDKERIQPPPPGRFLATRWSPISRTPRYPA